MQAIRTARVCKESRESRAFQQLRARSGDDASFPVGDLLGKSASRAQCKHGRKCHMSGTPKHEGKAGRPIRTPHVLENAGDLAGSILDNFISYKYFIDRREGLGRHFILSYIRAWTVRLRVHRHWIQGRKVRGKWQRYLNRLAHEMDELYTHPDVVAVLLFGLQVLKRTEQIPNDLSESDKAWLRQSSGIGEFCRFPRMHPSPEERFITDAMVLGDRLGLFVDDKQENAVKQLLTQFTEIRPDRLLPLGAWIHTKTPSYFQPSTGHLTFHDMLCVKMEDLIDPKKK